MSTDAAESSQASITNMPKANGPVPGAVSQPPADVNAGLRDRGFTEDEIAELDGKPTGDRKSSRKRNRQLNLPEKAFRKPFTILTEAGSKKKRLAGIIADEVKIVLGFSDKTAVVIEIAESGGYTRLEYREATFLEKTQVNVIPKATYDKKRAELDRLKAELGEK